MSDPAQQVYLIGVPIHSKRDIYTNLTKVEQGIIETFANRLLTGLPRDLTYGLVTSEGLRVSGVSAIIHPYLQQSSSADVKPKVEPYLLNLTDDFSLDDLERLGPIMLQRVLQHLSQNDILFIVSSSTSIISLRYGIVDHYGIKSRGISKPGDLLTTSMFDLSELEVAVADALGEKPVTLVGMTAAD